MYSLVGQKRRFSEKGLVISLAAFFFLLPIVLYMPQILNGESIISGDGLLVLFSGDALRESLLEGEIPLWSPAIAFGEPFAELNNHCYSPIFVICSLFAHFVATAVLFGDALCHCGGLDFFAVAPIGMQKECQSFNYHNLFVHNSYGGHKKRALHPDCCKYICSACYTVA